MDDAVVSQGLCIQNICKSFFSLSDDPVAALANMPHDIFNYDISFFFKPALMNTETGNRCTFFLSFIYLTKSSKPAFRWIAGQHFM